MVLLEKLRNHFQKSAFVISYLDNVRKTSENVYLDFSKKKKKLDEVYSFFNNPG